MGNGRYRQPLMGTDSPAQIGGIRASHQLMCVGYFCRPTTLLIKTDPTVSRTVPHAFLGSASECG